MAAEGSTREGLLSLREAASRFLPLAGVGVIRPDHPEHFAMVYVDAYGLTAYRVAARTVSDVLGAPLTELRSVSPAELQAGPLTVLEARLLLIAPLPAELREPYVMCQLVMLPFPEGDPRAKVLLGVSTADALTSEQIEGAWALLEGAGQDLHRPESAGDELQRLRRLEATDALLPAVVRVLDIREVFDRVSELTQDVLPHDILSLGLFSPDLSEVTVYAHTSPERLPEVVPVPYPRILMDDWVYTIVDDHLAHPIDKGDPLTKAGGRSSVRVAIRLDDATLGGMTFTSREPSVYTSADVAIARRVADYVAIALSHHRLAEEARQAEELRVRAASHDLLDELLATVTDTGGLREVFDRVSGVAGKVLQHDALALPVLMPDRRHLHVYASSGAPFPEGVTPLPEELRKPPDWEYDIVPDLQSSEADRGTPPVRLGYRSSLRVAIRLEGQLEGALDFLSFAANVYKPTDLPIARRIADRLALSLSREKRVEATKRAEAATARASQLESRVRTLTEELSARAGYRRVIGDSRSWREALTQATQVAATETTVLLLGESGTGKEVVARFVHAGSARAGGPFVALNCAALPENLLEAELFGYERGAFTGAVQSKPGQLEQASGGTLFLDEVAEMSPSSQAKFLRVLQEREFQRVGGTRVLKTDARIVAATNRDLLKAMERGQFREDLYYRLNVFAIRLPALRDRRDDVLPLTDAFVAEIGRTLGRPPGGVSREAREALLEYHWPGNVRELRNVLERAAILADGGLITASHLALRAPGATDPASRRPGPPTSPTSPPPAKDVPPAGDLKSVERSMIERALLDARYNKSVAARKLGLSRAQLYVRLRRHGLE